MLNVYGWSEYLILNSVTGVVLFWSQGLKHSPSNKKLWIPPSECSEVELWGAGVSGRPLFWLTCAGSPETPTLFYRVISGNEFSVWVSFWLSCGVEDGLIIPAAIFLSASAANYNPRTSCDFTLKVDKVRERYTNGKNDSWSNSIHLKRE